MPSSSVVAMAQEGGDDEGEDASNDVDDVASVVSHAASFASSAGGLVDVNREDIEEEPQWVGAACSAGVWEDETRGDGGAGEQDSSLPVAHGHTGHFGLLSANWGGKWKEAYLEEHMDRDLKNSPC